MPAGDEKMMDYAACLFRAADALNRASGIPANDWFEASLAYQCNQLLRVLENAQRALDICRERQRLVLQQEESL